MIIKAAVQMAVQGGVIISKKKKKKKVCMSLVRAFLKDKNEFQQASIFKENFKLNKEKE